MILLSSLLTLLVTIAVIYSFKRMQEAISLDRTGDEIQRSCLSLSFLVNDYFSGHPNRVENQWDIVYDRLEERLRFLAGYLDEPVRLKIS